MRRGTSFAPLLLLIGSLSISRTTLAQKPFRPASTYDPFYSFVDGQALYVAGGLDVLGGPIPTSQSFAINLTVSWNTSSPVFVQLSEAPAFDKAASALSADGKQWMVCSIENCLFSTVGGPWTKLLSVPSEVIDRVTATTDPQTGLVYIPNGLLDGFMMVVNIATKTFTKVAMAPPLLPSKQFAVAWSALAGKMYLFGGTTGNIGQTDRFLAYSYNKAEGWKDLSTLMKGKVPTARKDACIASAYGGSKLVLSGGFNMDRVKLLPEIFVLDVATLTWTQGPNPPAKDQRAAGACGVSGDYLISWGGLNSYEAITNSTTVFNIKTNSWTPSYIAAPPVLPPPNATVSGNVTLPTPTTSPNTPSNKDPENQGNQSTGNTSGDSSTTIVIVASVLGIVVAGLAVWALLLFRSQRRRNAQDENMDESELKPRNPSATTSSASVGRDPHESSEEVSLRNPGPWITAAAAAAPQFPSNQQLMSDQLMSEEFLRSNPHTSLPPAPAGMEAFGTADTHHPTTDALYSVAPTLWSQRSNVPMEKIQFDMERSPQHPHQPISADTHYYSDTVMGSPSNSRDVYQEKSHYPTHP
ncbi:MAG: hypothetical protein J3Q66DRAFT_438775 [Benniella sp.]|nr:MAG: hypothetical protein J3Q66DRAFT_438775 [Benniella sp.]